MQKGVLPFSYIYLNPPYTLATLSPGGIQPSPTGELVTSQPYILNALNMVAHISTLAGIELPFIRSSLVKTTYTVVNLNVHSTMFKHNRKDLQKGCSNQTEPWLQNVLSSLSINESIIEQTLAGTLCAPRGYSIIYAYIN